MSKTGSGIGFCNLKAHPQRHTSPKEAKPPNPSNPIKQLHPLVTKQSHILSYGGNLTQTTMACDNTDQLLEKITQMIPIDVFSQGGAMDSPGLFFLTND